MFCALNARVLPIPHCLRFQHNRFQLFPAFLSANTSILADSNLQNLLSIFLCCFHYSSCLLCLFQSQLITAYDDNDAYGQFMMNVGRNNQLKTDIYIHKPMEPFFLQEKKSWYRLCKFIFAFPSSNNMVRHPAFRYLLPLAAGKRLITQRVLDVFYFVQRT